MNPAIAQLGPENHYHEHLAKWRDLSSGISILYSGLDGIFDENTERLKLAMQSDDLEDMDHLTAVMLCVMRAWGKDVAQHSSWWGQLDREYHAYFCQDEICQKRRENEKPE